MPDRNKNKKQRQRAKAKKALQQQQPSSQCQEVSQSAEQDRPVRRSVEDLARAAKDDLFPGTVGVYFDYGFINTQTSTEAINLFGTYQGLIENLGCCLEDLHQACIENRLAEFVRKEYNKIPPGVNRGGYYPWFEKNTHIVKNNNPFPSTQPKLHRCSATLRYSLPPSLPDFPGPPLSLPISEAHELSDLDIQTLPAKDLVATLKSLKGIVSVDPKKSNEELRVEFEEILKGLRDEGANQNVRDEARSIPASSPNPVPRIGNVSYRDEEWCLREARRKLDEMKAENVKAEKEKREKELEPQKQSVTVEPNGQSQQSSSHEGLIANQEKEGKQRQRENKKQEALDPPSAEAQQETSEKPEDLRPLRRSVEDLARAAYDDLLPGAIGVYFDYGFINTKTDSEAINLFGTYLGLIKHLGCNLDELHQACLANHLAEFVHKEYITKIPNRTSRGRYYPWFERNAYIVRNSNPFPCTPRAEVESSGRGSHKLPPSLPIFPGPPNSLPMPKVLELSDLDIQNLPSKDLVGTLKSLKGIASVDPRKTNAELRVEFEEMLRTLRDEGVEQRNKTDNITANVSPPSTTRAQAQLASSVSQDDEWLLRLAKKKLEEISARKAKVEEEKKRAELEDNRKKLRNFSVDPTKTDSELRAEFEQMLRTLRHDSVNQRLETGKINSNTGSSSTMGAGVNLLNPEIISIRTGARMYAEMKAQFAEERRQKALGKKNQHTSTYSSPAAIRRWPAEKKPPWVGTTGYAVAFLSLLIFLACMGL